MPPAIINNPVTMMNNPKFTLLDTNINNLIANNPITKAINADNRAPIDHVNPCVIPIHKAAPKLTGMPII